MAKASAAPEAAAPAAPAPSPERPRALPQSKNAEPVVIQWDNDRQDAGMESLDAVQLQHDAETGKPKAKPTAADDLPAKGVPEPKSATPERGPDGKFKSAAEEAVDGDGEPVAAKAADPEPKVTPSEKRQSAMAALQAEQRARTLEAALKREQEERKADRDERARLDTLLKGGPLADVLKARGMSREDLEDLILRNGKELDDLPEKRTPVADPEVTALKDTVKKLTDRLEAAERAESDARVRQVLEQVQTATKDLDIPVTRAVDNGMELVLKTAHELWKNAGSQGPVGDHLPEAAKRAEAYFREQKPPLAALADAAKKAAAVKEEPGDKVEARTPSIGKRTAARPEVKSKSLWERGADGHFPDRNEVDLQIKREFGIKDQEQEL